VTPAATPPATEGSVPTSVPIPLNYWREAPFYLTDKDMVEAMEGIIPMQASEAIKRLGNYVDRIVLGEYKSFYGYHGTAGSTPFASTTTDATQVRKVLNNQLAPLGDRHVIVNPDCEANALDLRAFQDQSWSGSPAAIVEGDLNRKFGFQWWMNQNVLTHTAGTLSDGTGHRAITNGALAAGVTTMNIDATTLTGTIVEGDVFVFAGHTQTYVVTNTSTLTASGNAVTGVTFAPALQVAVGDGVQVTFKDTHVVNLAMHRDAIALASRPFEPIPNGLGAISQSAVDEITGLALRLEVTREHKRTRFSYDILFGVATVRRELGCRLAG
jgi:hypothetical protein